MKEGNGETDKTEKGRKQTINDERKVDREEIKKKINGNRRI